MLLRTARTLWLPLAALLLAGAVGACVAYPYGYYGYPYGYYGYPAYAYAPGVAIGVRGGWGWWGRWR